MTNHNSIRWLRVTVVPVVFLLSDLKAFERRLTEYVSCLQPATGRWRSKCLSGLMLQTMSAKVFYSAAHSMSCSYLSDPVCVDKNSFPVQSLQLDGKLSFSRVSVGLTLSRCALSSFSDFDSGVCLYGYWGLELVDRS